MWLIVPAQLEAKEKNRLLKKMCSFWVSHIASDERKETKNYKKAKEQTNSKWTQLHSIKMHICALCVYARARKLYVINPFAHSLSFSFNIIEERNEWNINDKIERFTHTELRPNDTSFADHFSFNSIF